MKINFYRDNEQKAPTVQYFLFSDRYAQIMAGQFIDYSGKNYRINSLQNTDQKFTLNAFIVELPHFRPATEENFGTSWQNQHF